MKVVRNPVKYQFFHPGVGFFLTRLPNPLNIISVGTLAIMTGVAIRVAQGRRIPAPVGG